MSDLALSLIVAGCVFSGGVVGLHLHRVLPPHHLAKETLDVIRLGTGMVSVLASLVFGLLIATAKSGADSAAHDMRAYAADTILLDRTLRGYGADAAEARMLLRRTTERTLHDLWPRPGENFVGIDDPSAADLLAGVQGAIDALHPAGPQQTWLQQGALQQSSSLVRQRWLLIEQEGPNVQPTILAVLITWTFAIFVSFGLNAPRNATVVGAFLMTSLAIGGAVFLILEMDSHFEGLLRLSELPLRNALAQLGGADPS
ncbi:DUF4239 domain-containing protein [Roseomonas nepalensis]|uniref:DUF4239 domain-containing protein n=1 Tax=Muricoccus nepalensis TaxID=1854500 RepID=A0A502FRM4_9PROT|nr:DUF4239 domain-containing protein [Roseomonas nepalensis]TPG51806.1 DUF4239 domain-containing protein [Roseomonas nepalensis]